MNSVNSVNNVDINDAYEEALCAYETAVGISERLQWRRSVKSLVERGAVKRDRLYYKVRELRNAGISDDIIKLQLRVRRLR